MAQAKISQERCNKDISTSPDDDAGSNALFFRTLIIITVLAITVAGIIIVNFVLAYLTVSTLTVLKDRELSASI